jgi:zinc protease
VVLQDRVDLVRLYLAWPTPPLFAPGDADLDVAADLLANGRTSRLYRRLVHDRRLATDVAAAQSSRELVSQFQVVVTIRAAIDEELERLRTDGPAEDELERGRARAESAFVYRLQSLGGSGGKADQLNSYNTFRGRPDYFDADLARYLSASRDSVRDAVRRFIDPARAIELTVVPRA